MKLNTDGLIIREQQTGDYDRLVTILTRDYGVIRAFANGAKRIKSRSQSATQLFAYGNFSIYRGRDAYSIDEAQPREIFFGLRSNIEYISLAQYICELAGETAPIEEAADDYLRLTLNALHMLAEQKRPPLQIKAIFELRIMCLSGYMPELTVCADCGREDSAEYYFSPVEGVTVCGDCMGDHTCIRLSDGELAAMRHICYSDERRLFSFRLSDDSLERLSDITEEYVVAQTGKKLRTLEFYKTMRG